MAEHKNQQTCFNCKHSKKFAPDITSHKCMVLCRRGSEQEPKWGDSEGIRLGHEGHEINREVAADDSMEKVVELNQPVERACVTDPASIVRSYNEWKPDWKEHTACDTPPLHIQMENEILRKALLAQAELSTAPPIMLQPGDQLDYVHGKEDDGVLRSFDTGATRDTAEGKLDPDGFTHPMVMEQYYKYMNMNRLQSNGELRDSDNWQKGIPKMAYMKSIKRHTDELWKEHHGFVTDNGLIAALCGIMFNSMGYLFEELKERSFELEDFDGDEPTPEMAERMAKLGK